MVFKETEDYEYFIELLCFQAKNYGVTLHNYCLMSNHYHLLVEIHHENLSKFMRQVNSNYAIYFNKKYKRVGHLWQGRFKSCYVTDEAYLYTLILYIEQNPLKAGMVKNVEECPYSSAHLFLMDKRDHCLHDAWITQHYLDDKESIKVFLESSVDTGQLQELKKASSMVEAPNSDKKPNEETLQKMLIKIKDTKERNKLIVKAYQKGYSQHMIAKILDLNQATVQRIIKRTKMDDSFGIR